VTQGATTLRSFLYDANGNILNDTRSGVLTAYTYNQNNRLKTVTVAGNLKATYTYNAAEQLAVRVLTNMTPSGTIHDVYDRDGNLLMESNGLSTGITREYIWLPGTEIAPATGAIAGVPRPIAVIDAVNTATPATWWVHADHLNRPVQMTDATKATVWQATWLPFGGPQAITGTATLDARFPGQWFQLESGLHQNWWRHYDPTTGRYTQPDPLGFVSGPSLYGYAKEEPQQLKDLYGLDTALIVGGASGDNPFGHAAIGFTGDGVYSSGTGTAPGSSLTNYLNSQSQYRNDDVYILKSSPSQEACMRLYLSSLPQQLGRWYSSRDNCATRTMDAMKHCGLGGPISSPLPFLPWDADIYGLMNNSDHIYIPYQSNAPSILNSFNPETRR
jgi:RHS repeat-associated protein